MSHASAAAAATAAAAHSPPPQQPYLHEHKHMQSDHRPERPDSVPSNASTSSSSPASDSMHGPHGPRDNHACFKLFVGAIPDHATEAELRAIFEPYGEIVDLVILHDRYTKMPRGCGFVVFASQSSAERAIHEVADKVKMAGALRELIVRYAGPRPEESEYKLYVSMLSHATTEEEVTRMFEHFGPLSEVVVLRSKDEQTLSKGSAFVKFQTKEAADLAIATMNQKVKDKNAPAVMQVRYAHTRDEKEAHFRQTAGSTPISGSMGSGLHVPAYAALGPSALSTLGGNAGGSMGLGSGGGVLSPAQMLGANAGTVAGANAYNQQMLAAQQQITNNAILQSLMQQQQQQEQIQRLALQTQQQQQQQQQPEHNMHLMRSFMSQAMGGAPHSSQQHLSGSVSPVAAVSSGSQLGSYYPSAASTPVSYSPPISSLQSHHAASSSSHYTSAASPAVIPSSKDLRGPDTCNLFVYNIPDYFAEEQLVHLFAHYGQIISTKVQRDRQTGASKGYGFVSYAEPRSAQLGISNLDGLIIDGKKLTVRLKTKQQDAALPVAPQAQAAQAAQLAAAAAAAAQQQQQQHHMYSPVMRGAVGSSSYSGSNGYATQSQPTQHQHPPHHGGGRQHSNGGGMDRRHSSASSYSPMFHAANQPSPYSQQQQAAQQGGGPNTAAAAGMSNLNSALSGLSLGVSGGSNVGGISQTGGSFFGGSPSPVSAPQTQHSAQHQQQQSQTFDSIMQHAMYLTHLQHQQAQQQGQAQQSTPMQSNQPAARSGSGVQPPHLGYDSSEQQTQQLQMYLRSQSNSQQPGGGY